MAVFRRGMGFGSYSFADDPAMLWRLLVDAVRAAEQSGSDFIAVPDHLAQNRIGGGPDAPMFEAYSILSALAMVTERVKLAAVVTPVTFRPPALLARAVCVPSTSRLAVERCSGLGPAGRASTRRTGSRFPRWGSGWIA